MHALPGAMLAPDLLATPRFAGAEASEREADLVLLVEDNDCVAGLVAHIVGRGGRRVLRARDGAECALLFAMHAAEVALVVLDCRLPDTDGVTLCRRLREIRPDLPVLLTSGQNDAGPCGLDRRTTAFVAKPFLPAQFVREVNALLAAIA